MFCIFLEVMQTLFTANCVQWKPLTARSLNENVTAVIILLINSVTTEIHPKKQECCKILTVLIYSIIPDLLVADSAQTWWATRCIKIWPNIKISQHKQGWGGAGAVSTGWGRSLRRICRSWWRPGWVSRRCYRWRPWRGRSHIPGQEGASHPSWTGRKGIVNQ